MRRVMRCSTEAEALIVRVRRNTGFRMRRSICESQSGAKGRSCSIRTHWHSPIRIVPRLRSGGLKAVPKGFLGSSLALKTRRRLSAGPLMRSRECDYAYDSAGRTATTSYPMQYGMRMSGAPLVSLLERVTSEPVSTSLVLRLVGSFLWLNGVYFVIHWPYRPENILARSTLILLSNLPLALPSAKYRRNAAKVR